MADEQQEPEAFIAFIDAEKALAFRKGLVKFLASTSEIGPIAQACIVAQTLGAACFVNQPEVCEELCRTIVLNFNYGVQSAAQEMAEQADRSTLN